MKKFASLFLALVMVCSLSISAFAAHTTTVTYTGTSTESYTLTVPATLTPGASGEVKANGTWASNRKLIVTAPSTVTLTNDIDGGTKTLNVTFDGINQAGNDTVAQTVTKDISVGNISNALFGTWSGIIVYTVSMENTQQDPIYSFVYKPTDETNIITSGFYISGHDVFTSNFDSDYTVTTYNANEYNAKINNLTSPISASITQDFSTIDYGDIGKVLMPNNLLGITVSDLSEYEFIVTWPSGHKTKAVFSIQSGTINGEVISAPAIQYIYCDGDGNITGSSEIHSVWMLDENTKTFILGKPDTVLYENMVFYVDCKDILLRTVLDTLWT